MIKDFENADTVDSHKKCECRWDEIREELLRLWKQILSHLSEDYQDLVRVSEGDPFEIISSLALIEEIRYQNYMRDQQLIEELKLQSNMQISLDVRQLREDLHKFSQDVNQNQQLHIVQLEKEFELKQQILQLKEELKRTCMIRRPQKSTYQSAINSRQLSPSQSMTIPRQISFKGTLQRVPFKHNA